MLQGGQSASDSQKNLPKNGKRRGKSGKIGKNEELKSGRKGKNREGSFTLPLLTDRAGYATGQSVLLLLLPLKYSPPLAYSRTVCLLGAGYVQ